MNLIHSLFHLINSFIIIINFALTLISNMILSHSILRLDQFLSDNTSIHSLGWPYKYNLFYLDLLLLCFFIQFLDNAFNLFNVFHRFERICTHCTHFYHSFIKAGCKIIKTQLLFIWYRDFKIKPNNLKKINCRIARNLIKIINNLSVFRLWQFCVY